MQYANLIYYALLVLMHVCCITNIFVSISQITLNKEQHFCPSTARLKTKMASYHWVAEKAIPILTKHPTMGAKKLQEELEDKYDITIGYGTVHMGFVIAGEKIHGTWEESFGYLFNSRQRLSSGCQEVLWR